MCYIHWPAKCTLNNRRCMQHYNNQPMTLLDHCSASCWRRLTLADCSVGLHRWMCNAVFRRWRLSTRTASSQYVDRLSTACRTPRLHCPPNSGNVTSVTTSARPAYVTLRYALRRRKIQLKNRVLVQCKNATQNEEFSKTVRYFDEIFSIFP